MLLNKANDYQTLTETCSQTELASYCSEGKDVEKCIKCKEYDAPAKVGPPCIPSVLLAKRLLITYF